MAKRYFAMKIRVSSHQNAENSGPEVEKQAPAEYITQEFCLPSTPTNGGTRQF